MRQPVYFSQSFSIPFRKRYWIPKFEHRPADKSYYSGQYYSQACSSFMWLGFRFSIVWKNK